MDLGVLPEDDQVLALIVGVLVDPLSLDSLATSAEVHCTVPKALLGH